MVAGLITRQAFDSGVQSALGLGTSNSLVDGSTFYGFPLFPNTDGTELKDAITCNACACDYLSFGRAIIAWLEGATLKVQVYSRLLEETDIANGSELTVATVATGAYNLGIIGLDESTAVVYYQTGLTLKSQLLTINSSDTVSTSGSALTLETFPSGYTLVGLCVKKVDSTKVFGIHRDSNNSTAVPNYTAWTNYNLDTTPAVSTVLDDANTTGSGSEKYPNSCKVLSSDRAIFGYGSNSGTGTYKLVSGISTNSLTEQDEQAFANSSRTAVVFGGTGATTANAITMDTNGITKVDKLSGLDGATITAAQNDFGRVFPYNNWVSSCNITSDQAFLFVGGEGNNAMGVNDADGSPPTITGMGPASPNDISLRPPSNASNSTVACCKLSDNTALGLWVDNSSNDLYMTRYR